MKKIIIPYFPAGLKYSAPPLLVGVGIYLWIIGHPVWIGVSVLISVILFTTNYVTEINVEKKVYRDYLSFLGMAFDEEKNRYNSIGKIIIIKERHAQVQNTRSRSRQINWESFTGVIVFDNNKTLALVTTTNKAELVEGLKGFSAFLNTGIEDQTTTRHYWIDTRRV